VRVVLLHERLAGNARADERDALVQLAAVERELRAAGHSCQSLAVDLDLERARRRLAQARPDLVFNLVESLGGSSRLAHLAPALVEALGIPCSGSSSTAFLETTDKLHAKRRLAAAGLPTPAWLEDGDEPGPAGRPDPQARLIVKPVYEDASVDLGDCCVVQGVAAARARLEAAGRPSFAESYVEGRELNAALLEKSSGVELLPLAEICFEAWPEGKPRIVGYAAKWQDDSFEAIHTPRRFDFLASDAPLLARLQDLAHRCWRLFGLRGFARVDFRVDAQGQPWILEVNANPCLSPDAGFAAAASRAGLSGRDVVDRIVAAAYSRGPVSAATR
jgi:D-alanine-D-alanine ligase